MKQTEGVILLADGHPCLQTEYCREYEIIGNRHENILFPIQKITDNTLLAEKLLEPTSLAEILLFIPLVGAIELQYHNETVFVEAGQVCYVPRQAIASIANPYKTELINYLEISLQNTDESIIYSIYSFEFHIPNQLYKILNTPQFCGYLGTYNGRIDDELTMSIGYKTVFVYVVNGVFEVQNRLLQSKDGLMLFDVATIEFESLAENSILFLLEM
jgi:quercetin 2,3-dioxygenase